MPTDGSSSGGKSIAFLRWSGRGSNWNVKLPDDFLLAFPKREMTDWRGRREQEMDPITNLSVAIRLVSCISLLLRLATTGRSFQSQIQVPASNTAASSPTTRPPDSLTFDLQMAAGVDPRLSDHYGTQKWRKLEPRPLIAASGCKRNTLVHSADICFRRPKSQGQAEEPQREK